MSLLAQTFKSGRASFLFKDIQMIKASENKLIYIKI